VNHIIQCQKGVKTTISVKEYKIWISIGLYPIKNFLERGEKKGCDNPKEDRKKKDERFRAEGEEERDEIILISRCITLNIK